MRDVAPYVKAVALTDFAEFVTLKGGDSGAILDSAGIARDALSRPESLLSFRSYCNLLELAASHLKMPQFGLELAQYNQPTFTNLGPIAILANFSRTLGEWIETGIKYWALHTNGFTMHLVRQKDGEMASMHYFTDSFVLPGRQISEHAMGCLALLARTGLGDHSINPSVVRFQHSRPADTGPHEALFSCPIEWGAERNEMVFPQKLLNLRTRGYMTLLKPLMERYVRKRIDRMRSYDQSATTTLSLAIPSLIGSGKCNAETIAAMLGTSLRMMQRQLSEEGTSFSEILDRVRDNLARNYLRETAIPVSRVAELLEYSSTAAFTNAFHRWSGMSPLKFRQQAQRLNRPPITPEH